MTRNQDKSSATQRIRRREPISNTNLLLAITVFTFFGMYAFAMLTWGGGFLNPQQFLDLFNNNSFLIVLSCGLTIVMIAGGIDISVGGITALVTMICVVYLDDHSGNRWRLNRVGAYHRPNVRIGAGIPCILSGDTAVYRHAGRHVLCKGHDGPLSAVRRAPPSTKHS